MDDLVEKDFKEQDYTQTIDLSHNNNPTDYSNNNLFPMHKFVSDSSAQQTEILTKTLDIKKPE
jgi:hypothetical protein